MWASLSAVACALAVAPPRIELNLEGMSKAYQLKESIIRPHDQFLQYPNGTAIQSRQDWTEKCPAWRICPVGKICNSDTSSDWVLTAANNHSSCPFPEAQGYDHQDKEVTVRTRIFLVDLNGDAQGSHMEVTTRSPPVDFTQRSTYLFKFDATDAAGNHAEQVVFALILDDTTAPYFKDSCDGSTFPMAPAVTVEAASDWELCQLDAFDNVDTYNVKDTKYWIEYLGREHDVFNGLNIKHGFFKPHGLESHPDISSYQGVPWETAKNFFSPVNHVGKYLVKFETRDNADVYGHNAQDNTRQKMQAILIRDQVAPTILLAGNSPVFVECVTDANGNRPVGDAGNWDFEAYTGLESDCQDRLDTELLSKYLPVTTLIEGTTISNIIGDASTSGTYPQFTHSPALKNAAIAAYLRHVDRLGSESTLQYTCDDYAANQATPVTRKVKTVDTHTPTLKLLNEVGGGHTEGTVDHHGWSITNVVMYAAHKHETDTQLPASIDQVSAADSCDTGVTSATVSKSWGPKAFNTLQLGDYVRTYTVSDANNNAATKTRTYTVVDQAAPEITVMNSATNCADKGCEPGTYEATRNAEYTDSGASCHDLVDGEISHAVEVSGEVVNLRIPGSYQIKYDCEDLTGNSAPTMYREIIVKDLTDPTITLQGTSVIHVEAGFPYVDAGATATDTLDGDITQYIWTDGNTVATRNAFYAYKSCEGIAKYHGCDASRPGIPCEGQGNSFSNGLYYITLNQGDSYKRQLVHCFKTPKATAAFTYYIHAAGTHASPNADTFHAAGAKRTCPQLGMITLDTLGPHHKKTIMDYIAQEEADAYELIGTGGQDWYVCTVPFGDYYDAATMQFARENAEKKGHLQIMNSEHGKYVINFNVEDKFGNSAEIVKRTVIVQDTLPPVITLKLNHKLVHKGESGQHGLPAAGHSGSMINPAGYAHPPANSPGAYNQFGNPDLRAEWNVAQEEDRAPAAVVSAHERHSSMHNEGSVAVDYRDAAVAHTNGMMSMSNFENAYSADMSNFGTRYSVKADGSPANGSLMAETSSFNGWMVGAVASGIAGVALLSYSVRRHAVSVPV